MENWKEIKDFNNYEVSNYGNVRRLDSLVIQSGINYKYKGRVLKQEICKGYKRVSLSKGKIIKRFQVHRLVSLYFLNNLENKPCVNHKDGNKFNNHIENLEWVTYSENEIHSYSVLGKINHNRKLIKSEIDDIRNNCVKGLNKNNKGNIDLFMKKYNVCKKTILNVINNIYYV